MLVLAHADAGLPADLIIVSGKAIDETAHEHHGEALLLILLVQNAWPVQGPLAGFGDSVEQGHCRVAPRTMNLMTVQVVSNDVSQDDYQVGWHEE